MFSLWKKSSEPLSNVQLLEKSFRRYVDSKSEVWKAEEDLGDKINKFIVEEKLLGNFKWEVFYQIKEEGECGIVLQLDWDEESLRKLFGWFSYDQKIKKMIGTSLMEYGLSFSRLYYVFDDITKLKDFCTNNNIKPTYKDYQEEDLKGSLQVYEEGLNIAKRGRKSILDKLKQIKENTDPLKKWLSEEKG